MGKVEEKAMRRRMLRLQIHLWKEEEKEEGGGQEEEEELQTIMVVLVLVWVAEKACRRRRVSRCKARRRKQRRTAGPTRPRARLRLALCVASKQSCRGGVNWLDGLGSGVQGPVGSGWAWGLGCEVDEL